MDRVVASEKQGVAAWAIPLFRERCNLSCVVHVTLRETCDIQKIEALGGMVPVNQAGVVMDTFMLVPGTPPAMPRKEDSNQQATAAVDASGDARRSPRLQSGRGQQ